MKKLVIIKKNYEFQKIIKKNNRFFLNNFILFVSKNDLNYPRFGISIGKKQYRLAVVRNRLKRQIKHIIQTYLQNDKNFNQISADIIIIVKVKVNNKKADFTKLKENLNKSLNILKLKITNIK